MGNRGSSCGYMTIKDGEAFAVSRNTGEVQIVEGPASILRMGKVFEQLERVAAREDEYLIVKFRDGRTEFRPGPVSMLRHPIDHISVTCEQALKLGDHELLVVYRKMEGEAGQSGAGSSSGEARSVGHVRRELVRGAGIYIPQSASEWIHQFKWTGSPDPARGMEAAHVKKIGALQFQKLRTKSGKTYVDVENVRTKDNALLTVKLMIFFNYTDVEKMLDNTNDPFGDLINAVTADVIEWCAPQKFDEFLAATDSLNRLELYAQLRSTAVAIGMEVEKVVFRGYTAPSNLQKLHDKAIEERTSLTLTKEKEEEVQRLADFKLKCESERAEQKARLEMNRREHELLMAKKTKDAENAQRSQEFDIELNRLREIKALDPNAKICEYLTAKEGHVPTVVQCGTMMSGAEIQAAAQR